MAKHTRLELTWIGKDDRPRLEPRILIEDPEKSYHAPHRVSKYLCISSLTLSPNIFAEYKSFYARKLMVEYLSMTFSTMY